MMKEKMIPTLGYTRMLEFNSISELIKFTHTEPNKGFFSNRECSSIEESSSATKFTNTKTYEEAEEMLIKGWNLKTKELMTKLNQQDTCIATKQKSVYDVVGGQASVPRYLQGVPTNMIRQVRVKTKAKIVNINKNITYSGSVSASDITEKCLDCIKYVNTLEAKGTKCNVYVVIVSTTNSNRRSKGETVAIRVKVKSANERMNIAKLSFSMCHPSMLRRIGFKLIEKSGVTDTRFISYGYPLREKGSLNKIYPNTEFFD